MNFKTFRKKLYILFLFMGLLTGASATVYSQGTDKYRRSKHPLTAAKRVAADKRLVRDLPRTSVVRDEKAVEQLKRDGVFDSLIEAVAAARQNDAPMPGAVALDTVSQTAKLTHTGLTDDNFGNSVAIFGDTAVVGAPLDTRDANAQGAAYVFVRSGGTNWTQQARLAATDGLAGDLFGWNVAISADTIVVGAPADDGTALDQGSAYVFTRSGTTWSQQQRLTAGDADSQDLFGISVSVSGNTVAVGAIENNETINSNNKGSAYVFVRGGTNWTQQTKIVAASTSANSVFGGSIAVDGDTLVVGAPADNFGTDLFQGSAFIFVRNGTNWTQQAQFSRDGSGNEDNFGASVAVSGNTVVVGAPLDDVNSVIDQGSAYVYVRSGATWAQQAQLNGANSTRDDTFGDSVSISGDNIIVGASGDSFGAKLEQGSAYIFVRNGANWAQQQQLTAADGMDGDFFGNSVSVSGSNFIVGAFLDDIGSNFDQGSAYIFAPLNTTAAPTVTSIDPNTRGAGGAAFEIVVNGTGFLSNSVVRFNGQNRTTTFVSATQLRAQILASDVQTAGQFPVTVFNPTNGDASNAINFTVVACSYSINPVSRNFASAGGSDSFTVTAPDGCASTAVSSASFIAITGSASGSGTRAISFSVAANTGAARTGTITVGGQVFTITQEAGTVATPRRTRFDFDGDGKADISVFRPSNNTWYFLTSAGFSLTNFGANGDIPVAADYDGDGKTDIAVFRPSNNTWYFLTSAGFSLVNFGAAGDVPVTGDYDGDGRSDIAVFRPSNGTWYLLTSAGFSVVSFGVSGDIPVSGDYNGDGKSDIAVFRPSNNTWYFLTSAGFSLTNFGADGDIPVAADYDGDGKTDIAVFRPSNNTWYFLTSAGFSLTNFGAAGDIPVPADYNGDGRSDIAVFRPSNNTWYFLTSAGFSLTNFGAAGDIPIPRAPRN